MIAVDRLSFTYPGTKVPAVNDMHFTVAEGEIFGLLGPSGAGKSTTQNVLIKSLRGYGGTAKVLGKDVAAWSHEYFEQVGVSFESPSHFLKLTARENLRYFAALYRESTRAPEEVLADVGLLEHADKRVSAFSKGMRIRLNLARSLLHRPRILFLDEPTSGLDPVNAASVRDLILRCRDHGTTVFLTTHDMQTADVLCDRVAFVVDGRIRELAPPRELKMRYGRSEVTVEYVRGGARSSRSFPLPSLGENPEFLDLLRRSHVETIHSHESTLAEVFIVVTGRALA